MNNGQTSPQDNVPNFFTSGAGTNSVNENNFESENNLDLTNTTTDWNLPTPDRDQRKIGNQAIASAESLNLSNETDSPPSVENIAEKINALTGNKAETNQVALNPAITQVETPLTPPQFEKSHIKTDDRLSDTAVAAIDQAKTKLDQDGDIASFYDTARNMMEVNLENSYNRKLASWNT